MSVGGRLKCRMLLLMWVAYSSVECCCSSEALLHTWDVDANTRPKCWTALKPLILNNSTLIVHRLLMTMEYLYVEVMYIFGLYEWQPNAKFMFHAGTNPNH